MSEKLNKLAEIVLDRVYTYGYQQRAAEDEQCRADDDLLAAQRKLADVAAERDKLAAECETLRQQFGNAQRELSEQGFPHSVELLLEETADLRQQLDAAQGQLTRERLDAEERGEKLDRLRKDHARLGRLVDAQRHEPERLRTFVDRSRRILGVSVSYADVDRLRAALAELDAGTTQSAPVTEPAPQRELSEQAQDASSPSWAPLTADLRKRLNAAQAALTRERLDAEARDKELEQLRAFVAQVRSVVESEWYGPEMSYVREFLAKLDDGTIEPAPVTEPLDPDTRGQELERLRAFVAKAREPRQRRRDETDFQSIPSAYCNRALDELDAANPAPTSEPEDVEGVK